MGPDLELKGRSDIVMEASASGNKETAGVMKEPEDKYVRCASNYEDNTFEMEVLMDEQTGRADRSQDVEVNIVDCTASGDIGLVKAEFQDATENSSSFDDTMLSDAEVESELHGDPSSPAMRFNGYSEPFRMRKKRLTPHWRTHIQPLMWRCKWVELQIKKFESQAMKYDRELAKHNRRKQSEFENSVLEGFCAKSRPFFGPSRRKEVMKRKRRKRVEDTVDIASYMSHHNLFSYYESKRSAADTALLDDDKSSQVICKEKINGNNEIGVNDELSSLERDGDSSLEQVLWKIGIVESQVSQMKTRLHKIMSENATKFSSTDELNMLAPCNALTSSSRKPASPHNNGDIMPVGSSYIATQLIPEYDMGDPVMRESAASSHGEVNHVPDIIESTDQPEVGGSSKNTGDGILIYNRRAKRETNNTKEVNIQPIEKPQVPKEEQDSSIPPFHDLEADLPDDDQPTPKIRSISKLTATKNKRKRGRRKAGTSRWSRRSSG
ncbi:uncharacterized protein LOC114295346 isoform X1 [Camellia sinensis]|uniref:uncharacterized protein LOC114295346 isoform X1 n=1 Tax=Camellia sinensis TaxID=4442 RepID=UPI001036A3FC|nr:uncharacterized protein LOC114295346 isoform X1 [Camellia sinensis]XP_028095370.1 uncharacterized protein LOC114295346 isoform X1 [Camellia sinensis]XP_028095371.1 uncharacterized protein LOC114295346 isoform X1 [Camellia sinensis]XP_028095372.1 uncharacterized protein LOC114295346 isoform X1 [Camellia sinensis]XP_028095373.1 uncharacterized protein LOC114295346 isoform X1 [Camellia sinensis]XP_028095374.1 uncharacterized protein LOC114295346 isoform X1 [Camellia sinensis]XP_028095375.1 un